MELQEAIEAYNAAGKKLEAIHEKRKQLKETILSFAEFKSGDKVLITHFRPDWWPESYQVPAAQEAFVRFVKVDVVDGKFLYSFNKLKKNGTQSSLQLYPQSYSFTLSKLDNGTN